MIKQHQRRRVTNPSSEPRVAALSTYLLRTTTGCPA